ncbi:MAG: hydroxylamine reductase [Lentisphaerae bacterium]|nr:hydroxylamine reductase [Lentisphaerota bacterium]
MFCFQCQETFANTGCISRGVCGKSAAVANLMDELIRQLKLIALTRKPDRQLGRFIIRSLFMTVTNTNFDENILQKQLDKAVELTGEHLILLPAGVLSCKHGDIRSLRELLIYGLKGIAAYAEHAAVMGKEDDGIYDFCFQALAASARENDADNLLDLILEAGSIAVKTMDLLDRAHTEKFGIPEITAVKTGVGSRPGILVSGHDLPDLLELLEQSKNSGIDIYTHGEMLPAHAYPELKKYPHLYGNYGNSWYLQHREFTSFNGVILLTTNCITPVQESYRRRIFTTGMAGYPGIPHIADRQYGEAKDFSRLIESAKRCPPPEPLENGTVFTGSGHAQLLVLAEKLAEAIRSGAVKRLVVMAGCDGRDPHRRYYREVAENLPPDTIILTAGCAKYRYNKVVNGEINGIPRVLDAGQCNDCYSLAVIALKLKEIFQVADINDLPVSFDISWYEQKAVAVLLALLHLGFKNIRLGPTLPAFLSPAVASMLIKTFDIKCIGDPQTDISAMLCGN